MSEVKLVEYDPSWPDQYEAFRSAILNVIPDARVEHIGSTSIPGCTAKPIIDISVGLALGSSIRDVSFRAAGLTFRSIQPSSVVFSIEHPDGSRWANVHVRYKGSEAELSDLRFRDFLRSHPGAVRAYIEAKRLALSESRNGGDYKRTKSPLIEPLLAEARKWAEASHQWEE